MNRQSEQRMAAWQQRRSGETRAMLSEGAKMTRDDLSILEDILLAAESSEWNVRMPAQEQLRRVIHEDGHAYLRDLIAKLRAERDRWQRLRDWLIERNLPGVPRPVLGADVVLRAMDELEKQPPAQLRSPREAGGSEEPRRPEAE